MDTLFTSFVGCGVQTANMTELGTADNRFHQRFDAVGLVFEGFGPIGERRERDDRGEADGERPERQRGALRVAQERPPAEPLLERRDAPEREAGDRPERSEEAREEERAGDPRREDAGIARRASPRYRITICCGYIATDGRPPG